MPWEVSDDFKTEKNKLFQVAGIYWLYEIMVNRGANVYRFVANESAITYKGDTYHPNAIAVLEIEEAKQGNLPTVQLVLDNATREVEALLEHHDGLRGELVRIHCVHEDHLADGDGMSRVYRIRSVTADERAATATLSSHPLLTSKWPYRLYLRNHCRHTYEDEFCGADGAVNGIVQCSYTLTGPVGCIAVGDAEVAASQPRLHPQRWGAEPLIPRRRGP